MLDVQDWQHKPGYLKRFKVILTMNDQLNAKLQRMKRSGDFSRLESIRAEASGLVAKAAIEIQQQATMGELPHASKFADLKRINVLIKDVGGILRKYIPCAQACSACCHQAITITEPEAIRIGRAIGRTPSMVPALTLAQIESADAKKSEDVARYSGKACPFLVDNKCSVYDVRPAICRLHHSMHSDNSLCQLDEVRDVPAMDLTALEMAFVVTQGSYTLADIRVFFPDARHQPT